MTNGRIVSALATVLLCFSTQAAGQGGKPEVRLTEAGSPAAPAISVEASDAVGLDSLDIACPAADSNYHTQLSRAAIDRHFKRTFTLSELFPAAGTGPVRLEVTVRNTRGATASKSIVVRPNSKKGK